MLLIIFLFLKIDKFKYLKCISLINLQFINCLFVGYKYYEKMSIINLINLTQINILLQFFEFLTNVILKTKRNI